MKVKIVTSAKIENGETLYVADFFHRQGGKGGTWIPGVALSHQQAPYMNITDTDINRFADSIYAAIETRCQNFPKTKIKIA